MESEITLKIKMSFGILDLPSPQANTSVANANPFAVAGKEERGTYLLQKLQEDLKGGYTHPSQPGLLQGKRMASTFSLEELSKGDSGLFQEPSTSKSPIQHQDSGTP